MINYQKKVKEVLIRNWKGIFSKVIACICLLFILSKAVIAQNASYNINSVPITGSANSAFGVNVLLNNTSGVNNSALGYESLLNNTTGHENTAIGVKALKSNTFGPYNSAFGYEALLNNLSGRENTAIGVDALKSNVAGQYNTATGFGSLAYNINGSYNTATGYVALGNSATSGNGFNTGIGSYSLVANTSGDNNTALGSFSLYSNTSGSFNTGLGILADVGLGNLTNATAIGANSIVNASNTIQLGDGNVIEVIAGTGTNAKVIAGKLQITGGLPGVGKVLTSDFAGNATWQLPSGGSSWSLIGNAGTIDGTSFMGTTDNVPLNFRVNNQKAGRIDPTLNNSFYGISAGRDNSLGINNTATGFEALAFSDGDNNTATGYQALTNNSKGDNNTAVGYQALNTNTDENNLTALGYRALYSNTTGTENVATGFNALLSNTSGSGNTANGYEALSSNSTGSFNVANGYSALKNNTTGTSNIAVGTNSLLSNTTGQNNIAVGVDALQGNTTGFDNVALGELALNANTTGAGNTATGLVTLWNNTTGEVNTGMGWSTLTNNTTGNYNAAFGANALNSNTTGTFNSALGFGADVSTTNLTNATAIGNGAIVNASNKVRIGDANITICEIVNTAVYMGSDGRFKTNIKEEDVKGLEFIKRLRPVTYNFDTRKFEEFLTKNMPDSVRKTRLNRDFSASTSIRKSGFIAQEVEIAANEIGYNFDAIHKPESKDDNYSLAYSQFVVPLVKAVQELSKQNDELKKEMEELKALVKANATKNIEGSIKINESSEEGAKLFQNAPNPFNKSTVIRYSIPTTAKKAIITIVSVNGVNMKEFDVKNKAQSIEISGGQLSAGAYIYSLFVDGVLIDSKQMILTK